jgi:hypothetical protein
LSQVPPPSQAEASGNRHTTAETRNGASADYADDTHCQTGAAEAKCRPDADGGVSQDIHRFRRLRRFGFGTQDLESGVSRSKRVPYISSYIPPYLSAYADLCRALRRHARLHLNLSMYLYLYLYLYLTPHAALFAEPFRKPNASSLASKLSSNLRLNLNLNLGLFLTRLLPPRQSVGRPLPDRIGVAP